ncbi:MAG: PGF-CTERM sorting domain-containing protein [Halobacteriota archaeon]
MRRRAKAPLPGFEIIFALLGLLSAAYILSGRR